MIKQLDPSLVVERVSDSGQLAFLAAKWDQLIEPSSPGAVFRSSLWLVPWWTCFGRGKELSLYVATRQGEIVGVLPAYRTPTAFGGSQLRLMGDGTVASDFLGVIARPDDLVAASRAIADAVVADVGGLYFDNLAEGDPLVAALDASVQSSRGTFARSSKQYIACPFIPIGEAGEYSDWLRGRPEGTGAQFQRRRRWLERQVGFRLEVVSDEGDIARAMPELWSLHHARWSLAGGSHAVDRAEVEHFHYKSGRGFARQGWARIYLLHVDGAPRAALYGFERGGRFAYYQAGNDPAWRQRSVGLVVMGMAIEDAFARGLVEFDFLRGETEFKRRFASASRQVVRLGMAWEQRVKAAWALEDWRAAARRLTLTALPDPTVIWIRRRLRQVLGRR